MAAMLADNADASLIYSATCARAAVARAAMPVMARR